MDISYNKVTRVVWAKVGDKLYHFRLNINGLQELEAVAFGGQSYFDFQRTHDTMPLGALMEAYRIMLHAGGDKTDAKVPGKVIEAISMEEGLERAQAIFYVTLAVSGILGVKQSNDMLKALKVASKDIKEAEAEEEQREKNE